MKYPLVTVIIPVYNVERYLTGCINSVLTQTYKNIEIILVDDGSPDKCPDICDKYADKHPNVIVIHKLNGGLSEARNFGMEKAKGDFILFLDSDDQLYNQNVIDGLINKAISSNADIIIPDSYIRVKENSTKEQLRFHFKPIKSINDPISFAIEVIIEQARAWRTTALLYKRSIVLENKITFPVGYVAEDIIFNLLLFSKASTIEIYNKPTLRNLKRTGSITTSFQESLGDVFLFIDHKVLEFLVSINRADDKGIEKWNKLLCRNTIVYISSLFSKKCNWDFEKKVRIADDFLNSERVRSAFRVKKINPFFDSVFIRIYFKIMFYLIRFQQRKIAYHFTKFIRKN